MNYQEDEERQGSMIRPATHLWQLKDEGATSSRKGKIILSNRRNVSFPNQGKVFY